jgi:hypothetical protein
MMIIDAEQKCLECGIKCLNRSSLANHLAKSHKDVGGQQGYVIKHFLNGNIPLCKCGCGNQVKWHKLLYKFNEFITGHNSKGKRMGFCAKDFKHTQAQIEKRNQSIKETYTKNKNELSKKIGLAVSNAFKDPEKNKRLREGQIKGWKDDSERRKDLIQRNIEMLKQGLIGPQAPFKTEWKMNPFTGKQEFMHSSWESTFMDLCISKNYPITKDHGITIPYKHPDGTEHTYIPDFYASEDHVLYEIKGRHDEIDKAKWIAAEEFCRDRNFSFVIIFENST